MGALIVAAILVVLFGKVIIAAAALVGLMIMTAPQHPINNYERPTAPITYPIFTEEKENVVEPDEQSMFMEDCLSLMNNDKVHCNDIWHDRMREEEKILRSSKG